METDPTENSNVCVGGGGGGAKAKGRFYIERKEVGLKMNSLKRWIGFGARWRIRN